ncbi:hypothetical protein [Ideonella sp.]|uniref:hypothetical protein n=1 Tax=Ideonella sp. TaxID=1929293 RepID=UPI0035B45225
MATALLGLVVCAADAGAAGSAAAAPRAAEPLPAVNLLVQWRLQPWPGPALAAHAPGSVVVGTATGSSPAAAAGPDGVVVRTAPAADPPSAVRVRNGGQAHWRLLRDEPEAGVAWVWTPEGAGLAGGTVRHGRVLGLQVQVRWPGGAAPAWVAWQFEQPLPDEADGRRGAAARQAGGELHLPLDSWQPLGRWTQPDGSGEMLELRIMRLP